MGSTMYALQFELSIPRYLCTKALCRVASHRFFAGLSCLHARDVAVPELPGPEWVRVRVESCGICGSDLNALRGQESFSMEPYASFPAVMGHEIVGRVVECGRDARDVAEGTRVAVENVLPCAPRGITPPCDFCARGEYALCDNFTGGCLAPGVITGFTRGLGGGFGEFVVAHRSQLFPIPAVVPLEHAVLVDSLASAMQPVAQHLPGDNTTVLVFGSGIIGLNTIQCLRAAGFGGRLIAVARHQFQADWAGRLGADEIIRGNIFQEISELTGARLHKPTLGPPVMDGGVDCVFDCVGSSRTIDTALRVTRKRGKVVVVGTAGMISNVDASPLWFKEITLTGSAMFSHTTVLGKRQRTYQHVIDLLANGGLKAAGLVTHRFPLRDYTTAFNVALDKRDHHSLKVVFNVD